MMDLSSFPSSDGLFPPLFPSACLVTAFPCPPLLLSPSHTLSCSYPSPPFQHLRAVAVFHFSVLVTSHLLPGSYQTVFGKLYMYHRSLHAFTLSFFSLTQVMVAFLCPLVPYVQGVGFIDTFIPVLLLSLCI